MELAKLNRFWQLVAATLLVGGQLIFVGPAQAQSRAAKADAPTDFDVSWTYFETGFAYADVDDDADALNDGEGIGFRLRYGIFENFHLAADYTWVKLGTDGGVEPRLSELFVGPGLHVPVAERTDLFAELGYSFAEVDTDNANEDTNSDNGLGFRAGVRSLVSQNLEIGLSGSWLERFDEHVFGGEFSARYFFGWLGLGFDVSYDDEDTLRALGMFRLDFTRS